MKRCKQCQLENNKGIYDKKDCSNHKSNTIKPSRGKTVEKIKIYKVEDDVEVPMLYDNLEHAMESVKELIEGINVGSPIKITCVEMTQKKYNSIPEF